MRTRHILILLLCAIPFGVSAEYSPGYYDQMEGKRQSALKAAAKECVQSHKTLYYYDLPLYWQYSDVYPELVNGSRRWWEMYSNQIYLITPGQNAKSSFSSNKMQREHSVPKSWWKKNNDVEYTPAYSDMWNLYPSDGAANQAKLNYPLGICASTTFDNGCTKVGPAKAGTGGGSGMVFEPADEYKGDFARSFFYMATVYDDLPWTYTYMFRTQAYPTLQPWAVQMLLQWAREDKVSQKEIDRNDEVEKSQGNRNPFIDFPELAEYIWGVRQEETFIIAEQGGSITPPITGDAEITAPVNGEALDFGQAAVGIGTMATLEINGRNMTQKLSVRIVGTDKAFFTIPVSSIPPSQINSGNGYKLPIAYNPASTGRHEAKLVLSDGGLPGGRSIVVNLVAEALPVPVLSRLLALPATGVEGNTYTANWQPAPETVDYYVLTRVRYLEDGEETEKEESDTNSFQVTDRDPAVMETYTVCSSRLGCLSEASNSVLVGADAGAVSLGGGVPFRIGTSEGGFVIVGGYEVSGLLVFDMSGRTVLSLPSVSEGDFISLSPGIYMITAEGVSRPFKLIVK